jgi:uncharacterized integral membrane protein
VWLLRIILFVALLVVLVWVGLQNDAPVDVSIFGKSFTGVRLFVVMFVAALLGFVAGLLLSVWREVRLRFALGREVREKTLLQREVGELRAAPLQGLDTGPAPGPEPPSQGEPLMRPPETV